MAAGISSKAHTLSAWTLRVFLGLVFLIVGAAKLTGTGNTVEYFAAIGWGQGFRYLTGALDLAGVAMLFLPRWTGYGALVLSCSVGTAAVLALTVLRGNPMWGGPQMVFVPTAITLLALALAWLTLRDRTLKHSR